MYSSLPSCWVFLAISAGTLVVKLDVRLEIPYIHGGFHGKVTENQQGMGLSIATTGRWYERWMSRRDRTSITKRVAEDVHMDWFYWEIFAGNQSKNVPLIYFGIFDSEITSGKLKWLWQNHHLQWENSPSMAMFNGYVTLPEGMGVHQGELDCDLPQWIVEKNNPPNSISQRYSHIAHTSPPLYYVYIYIHVDI